MKNDKICFNQKTGIIVVISLFLLGLVLASQKLSMVQTSTDSRASAPKSTGDLCIDTHIIGELWWKVDSTLVNGGVCLRSYGKGDCKGMITNHAKAKCSGLDPMCKKIGTKMYCEIEIPDKSKY